VGRFVQASRSYSIHSLLLQRPSPPMPRLQMSRLPLQISSALGHTAANILSTREAHQGDFHRRQLPRHEAFSPLGRAYIPGSDTGSAKQPAIPAHRRACRTWPPLSRNQSCVQSGSQAEAGLVTVRYFLHWSSRNISCPSLGLLGEP
jgi:hypothetical protein